MENIRGGAVLSIKNEVNSPGTVLHFFDPQLNGGHPADALVFGSGGLLYGVTPIISYINLTQYGTDFSLSPAGDSVEYRVIHSFGQPGDGTSPVGLTLLPQGYPSGFVGATAFTAGPNLDGGTVYLLPTTSTGRGREKIIAMFGTGTFDPSTPTSPPIVGQGRLSNAYYGCLGAGGTFGRGAIYQVARTATGYSNTILYNFGQHPGDAQKGSYSQCWIVQANDEGKLYGTSGGGGSNHNGGTFFELDPPTTAGAAWTEKVLYNFDPKIASAPYGAPVKIGKNYFGVVVTTPNGLGGVYELTP